MIYFDLALFVGGYVAAVLTYAKYVQPVLAKIRNKV